MALLKCPNCNELVSSFDEKCSECGTEINEDAIKKYKEKQNRAEQLAAEKRYEPVITELDTKPAHPFSSNEHTEVRYDRKGLAAWVVMFVAFGTIIAWLVVPNLIKTQSSFTQKEISGVNNESEYITMEEYGQIDTGMSYEEVQRIVGSPGEISSQVEIADNKTMIITWYGNGYAGSNANVTFSNDEVIGKAQIGLD